jgi:hypothetical protein
MDFAASVQPSFLVLLYPDIVRCGQRAAGPAGIYDASRFDK